MLMRLSMESMDEIEVAQILLQLPRLVAESEVLRMLPFTWGSKKKRGRSPNYTALPSPKTPLSFSDWKIRIPMKRKRSENGKNLLGFERKGERSGFCAVEEELPKRKKKVEPSNSGDFLLPDLNIPLMEEEEEERQMGHVFEDPIISKRAVAAEARRKRIQIVRSKKKTGNHAPS